MKKSAFLVVLALAFAMISYANVFAADAKDAKPAAKQEAKSEKKTEHKKSKHKKESKSSQGTNK